MKLSALLLVATMQQALAAALPAASIQSLEERGNQSISSGGYRDATCTSIYFPPGTTILFANCKRRDGSINFSQLELNNCVSLSGGEMIWGGSGFSYSCMSV